MTRDETARRILLAKDKLTICDLWGMLALPGEVPRVGKKVPCPIHNEKSGSFHLKDEGRFFKCFGCGAGGDQVNFIEGVTGLSRGDSMRKLLALAGFGDDFEGGDYIAPSPRAARAPKMASKPSKFNTTSGDGFQRKALSELRGLSLEAITRAASVDLLSFGEYRGLPCWFVSDVNWVNVQVRRMDGNLILGDRSRGEKDMKSRTIYGSRAGWPVGIEQAQQLILLVEGGPDLLAAFDDRARMGRNPSPVAMFGAWTPIHRAALPFFDGKDVVIVPHKDTAGERAWSVWSGQLEPIAKSVKRWVLPAGGDLNDYVKTKKEL